MPGLILEFPALVDPVSLAEAKNFLRMDDINDDDAFITSLISGATAVCEGFCRRSFIQKGFIQTLDAFPYFTDTIVSQLSYPPAYSAYPRYSTSLWNYSQMIKLFRPPLISVDRVTYMDSGLQSYVDLVPQPLPWYPQTVYKDGALAADNNGNVQMLTMGDPSFTGTGKSGTKPPTWNKTQGGITAEASPATAIWTNGGPLDKGEFGAYIVDAVSEPGRLFPGLTQKSGGGTGFWPSAMYVPNAVQIHFQAGYGPSASDVPAALKTAIMQVLSDAYENREPLKDDGVQLPKHVQQLLYPYRVLDLSPTRG